MRSRNNGGLSHWRPPYGNMLTNKFCLPYSVCNRKIAGTVYLSENTDMDPVKAEQKPIEVDHRGGVVTLTINSGETPITIGLSVVQASELVALLHKHINEAAVERLRRTH